jgi:hypothetical protein
VDCAILVSILIHDKIAARLHLLHETLVDVLLDNTAAQFFPGQAEFTLAFPRASDADSSAATCIPRKCDSDPIPYYGDALIAAQPASDNLALRDFQLDSFWCCGAVVPDETAHGLLGNCIAQGSGGRNHGCAKSGPGSHNHWS